MGQKPKGEVVTQKPIHSPKLEPKILFLGANASGKVCQTF
jgi:hypothetical protein